MSAVTVKRKALNLTNRRKFVKRIFPPQEKTPEKYLQKRLFHLMKLVQNKKMSKIDYEDRLKEIQRIKVKLGMKPATNFMGEKKIAEFKRKNLWEKLNSKERLLQEMSQRKLNPLQQREFIALQSEIAQIKKELGFKTKK
ncbi:MAG: hypothetical protein AB1467_05100 [Candidatus Diapherotrites archaeon]